MEITTINELKKHVGEYLAFVYKNHFGTDVVWIQKLYTVRDDDINYVENKRRFPLHYLGVNQLPTLGFFTAQVAPIVKEYTQTPKTPYYTNAQNIIRTPTKDEMNEYRKFWRKYRILGKI